MHLDVAALLRAIAVYHQLPKAVSHQLPMQENVTYQSSSDEDDPLIVGLRNEGRLMAHRFCNGTLLTR